MDSGAAKEFFSGTGVAYHSDILLRYGSHGFTAKMGTSRENILVWLKAAINTQTSISHPHSGDYDG